MGPKAAPSGTRLRRFRGFSLVELVVSLAVVLIMVAVALPSLTRSYRVYQLNDSANRLAGILKFTRFEAIRRNRPTTCRILQSGADWYVWTDSNGDGVVDSTETQYLITGIVTLLPDGVAPSPAAITAAVGASLTTLSGSNGSVAYDPRGAVNFAGAPSVYVLYLGDAGVPDYGYRAVVLLPSGVTQVWTAPASGTWQRIS